MGWGSHLAEAVRPVVDLVYPPRCPLCGDAIAEQSGLCGACFGDLEVPGEPACEKCARPIAVGKAQSSAECTICQHDPPHHSGVHAATIYNDASRKLVLTFKHGGKISLASLLGRLMAARLDMPEQMPLLVPVPLHRWRLWGRGFNQAALLAREIDRCGKGELLVDALVRSKRTPSLGGLGSDARRKALTGAIEVRPGRRTAIGGRRIILVDDVLTSGATSNACVEALLNAAASSIEIACFARVVNASAAGHTGGTKNTTPEAVKTPGAT